MRFEIGQEVWMASWESTETYITCPECGGTGRLRVLFHDDTMVSIECAACGPGYNPPTGRLKVYERRAMALPVTITGVEIREGKRPEWRTNRSYIVDEDDLFESEEAAFGRAKEKAANADREERARIMEKEKPTRTWAWNAHYHRREIKEAKRRIEYHEKKLAAANLKVREKSDAA